MTSRLNVDKVHKGMIRIHNACSVSTKMLTSKKQFDSIYIYEDMAK